MKYLPTITTDAFNLSANSLHVGQWLKDNTTGSRGQFLGVTAAKTVVIRWQKNSFQKRDAMANAALRSYATIYGAK